MSEGAKPERLPTKRETVEILFARGEDAWLHLDAQREDVTVPPRLKRFGLVLEIGLDMSLPIRDLEIDEAGFRGTLSFDRQPYHCTVPWDAVYLIIGSGGQGGVWKRLDPAPPKLALRRVK